MFIPPEGARQFVVKSYRDGGVIPSEFAVWIVPKQPGNITTPVCTRHPLWEVLTESFPEPYKRLTMKRYVEGRNTRFIVCICNGEFIE
jgi:hypothetical protein